MTSIAELLKTPGLTIDAADDIESATEFCMERGWGDGLPIVPPTVARVERMLAYCDRPWDEPVATMPPRNGAVTPLRLAANAVMAGCRPTYFPLLLLAVEAMCEEPLNLYGIQTTTHPACPLVIVNGPIARELGFNHGHNAFGPGYRPNAAIGRAIRLALLNIGGAIPGVGDMATMGHPGKYGYVIAENEASNPWEPLHVERGFPIEATTVTVVGSEGPHNINDHHSTTAAGVLTMVSGGVATATANNLWYAGEAVIALCPEHAATIASDGFSKLDVKRFIYQNATVPLRKFSPENVERRYRQKFPERYAHAPLDAPVYMTQTPDDFIVIVLGGAGKHSMYVPSFGETRSITRALKRRDGSLAASIEDMRRA